MANEFQHIPNPDNVPGLVTSGYQRQNTHLFVLQTGLDTTEPCDHGNGTITIPAGGVVEINGLMFKLEYAVSLPKPVPSRAYWIAITDNGNGTATAELVERPGAWNSAKQGCYTSNNKRTLNWVSLGDLYSAPDAGAQYSSPANKGIYDINLPTRGWKFARLASGMGGGDGHWGYYYNNGGMGGSGGVISTRNLTTVLFFYNGEKIRIKIGADAKNGYPGGRGGQTAAGTAGLGGGGGGGGGGGSGEESFLKVGNKEIANTGATLIGSGGSGGINNASGLGGDGGHGGGFSRGYNGENGQNASVLLSGGGNPEMPNTGGKGGIYSALGNASGQDGIAIGGGYGGGGGGGGARGEDGSLMPDGYSGGSCNIFAVD